MSVADCQQLHKLVTQAMYNRYTACKTHLCSQTRELELEGAKTTNVKSKLRLSLALISEMDKLLESPKSLGLKLQF